MTSFPLSHYRKIVQLRDGRTKKCTAISVTKERHSRQINWYADSWPYKGHCVTVTPFRCRLTYSTTLRLCASHVKLFLIACFHIELRWHTRLLLRYKVSRCATTSNGAATKRASIGRNVLQQGKSRQASTNSCTLNSVHSVSINQAITRTYLLTLFYKRLHNGSKIRRYW